MANSSFKITKDDIATLRGEFPGVCDFCGQPRPFTELEPEEGGCWVCSTCLTLWDFKEANAMRRERRAHGILVMSIWLSSAMLMAMAIYAIVRLM